jgi:hypothetical protein
MYIFKTYSDVSPTLLRSFSDSDSEGVELNSEGIACNHPESSRTTAYFPIEQQVILAHLQYKKIARVYSKSLPTQQVVTALVRVSKKCNKTS